MSSKCIAVYHKKYVRSPVRNKTGKLKVKIKASFSKNVVAIKIWNTVTFKKVVAVMKSDIF